jgi:hypothetical protein
MAALRKKEHKVADPSPTSPAATTALQQQLQAVAKVLQDVPSLNSEARLALAEFIEELSTTLNAAPGSSSDLTHLTECTTHLLKAAHEQKATGIPAAVRARFQDAVLDVQTQFPNVAALARTVVDALANIGI